VNVSPTSSEWIARAIADLPTLLVDHAHCEKKAAHTAVRFLFKYPEWPRLVAAMSKLAREELVHFDQVLRELRARGHGFRALQSGNYATELFRACTTPVDELLACALIEARSHERFVRLADAVPDEGLRAFYRELADAEARHGEIYLELAAELGPIRPRLDELTAREAEIIARPGQPLRMHSG
jgi:tRNA-(ms[2]io[6]A)-hydroxylase